MRGVLNKEETRKKAKDALTFAPVMYSSWREAFKSLFISSSNRAWKDKSISVVINTKHDKQKSNKDKL